LRWAVDTPARYIGMIGSKRKVIAIYKELEKEGIPRQKFERLRAPMGLDIGAITPEEIAVAVVGEMIAVRRHADAALPLMRYSLAEQAEPAPSTD
jgi:xanthine dehydrogenase accessory factor